MPYYGSPSPSPSPPPPDGYTYQPQQPSISDILLQLRRRAHDGHRQQQVQVINSDPPQLIIPIREADGTTRETAVFICNKPRRRRDIVYPRHHHQATTAATPYHRANNAASPYHRAEHHERQRNCRHQRSPAPHQGATKVVCLANMLSPGDRLEDDGFYQDFLEDVTKEARKFGELVEVVIPRPSIGGRAAPVVVGVGKVFLEYAHLDDAVWCRRRLDGRWYSGKEIAATFFSPGRFAAGDYA